MKRVSPIIEWSIENQIKHSHQSSRAAVDRWRNTVWRAVTEFIRTNVTRQVDVASLAGEIFRAQADEPVLPRHARRSVLARVGVAKVDLCVASVTSFHSGESHRARASVVPYGVHRPEHQRLWLVRLLFVAKLEDGRTFFKVETRLTDANVIVEGEELQEEQLLKQILV